MGLWWWSFRRHLSHTLTGQSDAARNVARGYANGAGVADGGGTARVGRVHVVNRIAVLADCGIQVSEGALKLI